MAKTMKAAVVRAFGKPLAIEEVPIPTPARGEVLVKIVTTGVCHTDLHAADGHWPVKPTTPFTQMPLFVSRAFQPIAAAVRTDRRRPAPALPRWRRRRRRS